MKRLMCTDNKNIKSILTVGKVYDIIGEGAWTYQIIDDYSKVGSYRKDRFSIVKESDNIKPEHYNKGKHDLYESWYLTRPFNEFRAVMESIAERYMKRDKIDRIEDLDKCMETLRRLREYEVRHKEEKDGVK